MFSFSKLFSKQTPQSVYVTAKVKPEAHIFPVKWSYYTEEQRYYSKVTGQFYVKRQGKYIALPGRA